MSDYESLSDFQDQIESLDASLGDASQVTAGFRAELQTVQAAFSQTLVQATSLERGLSRGLRRAFDDVVFDGATLSNALKTVSQSLIDTAYAAAVKPVAKHLGGSMAEGIGGLINGLFPLEHGAGFSQARVTPFANGGVVSGPVRFPMRGGSGMMGEAGPEAIMPLARGADDKLGVRAAPSGGTTIVMNIHTPDVRGFQRSQSQIAAQMSRMMGRSKRIR